MEADPDAEEGEEGQEKPPPKVVLTPISICGVTGALSTTASDADADADADAATVEGEEESANKKATGTAIDSHLDLFLRTISHYCVISGPTSGTIGCFGVGREIGSQ